MQIFCQRSTAPAQRLMLLSTCQEASAECFAAFLGVFPSRRIVNGGDRLQHRLSTRRYDEPRAVGRIDVAVYPTALYGGPMQCLKGEPCSSAHERTTEERILKP